MANPEQRKVLAQIEISGRLSLESKRALEFFDDFSNHQATELKADGNEIVSVEINVNREGQA